MKQVRVLAVGGGSGGLNGNAGGGGSGYVRTGIFAVSPFDWIQVTVGTGGAGSSKQMGVPNSHLQNSGAGGTTSFGSYLSAAGGEGKNGSLGTSASGGSGGGQGVGCYVRSGSTSGMGSTGGSTGFKANTSTCAGWDAGPGQGSYVSLLKIFTRNLLEPGDGGKGNSYKHNNYYIYGFSGDWHPGGGGGGGVLLNGNGPTAQAGESRYSNGFGGSGYGAGGGAGGCYWTNDPSTTSYAGGRGADGIVYIEW